MVAHSFVILTFSRQCFACFACLGDLSTLSESDRESTNILDDQQIPNKPARYPLFISLDLSSFKALYFDQSPRVARDVAACYTVETRIKEPTFLGDSLLKDLVFYL